VYFISKFVESVRHNMNNNKKKSTLDSVYGTVIMTNSFTWFIDCISMPMTADP